MRLVVLALLVPFATAAWAGIDHQASNETVVDGDGGQRSVNCGGGSLSVKGSGNNVSAAGCTSINVEGSGNTLLAHFDRAGAVRLTGNRNHLAWSAPAGGRVKITDLGTGNSTARR